MGTILSTFQPYKRSSSSKKTLVIAFHDSQKWKIHFEDSRATNKLMVIDFSASWCGPCRYMEPVIEGYAEKYTDVEFVEIDVDELKDVAEEFGIQAMPTFVLIRNGKQVDQLVGADPGELEKLIQKLRF